MLRLANFVVGAILVLSMAGAATASTKPISMIQLIRYSCEGVCPDYVLTLRSDGCANLKGNANFALIGNYSSPNADFKDAVAALNSHHFFQMRGEYPELPAGEILTDAPVARLKVYRGNDFPVEVTISGDSGIPPDTIELFHIIDGIGFTAYSFNDDTKAPVSTVHSGGSLTADPSKPGPCS